MPERATGLPQGQAPAPGAAPAGAAAAPAAAVRPERRGYPPASPELIARAVETGVYPHAERPARGAREAQLRRLQAELPKVRIRRRESGQKSVPVFGGRDAAGKARRSNGSWSTSIRATPGSSR